MQCPYHSIHSPEHFRYNPVPKTEVPKTRTDLSSTVHDLTHWLAHVLDEHFILLNSRLNKISVDSKNAQIGVRTGKLWPSEVGAADSQVWCRNLGIALFFILLRFAQFRDTVLGLDGPGNSYTRSMTVP